MGHPIRIDAPDTTHHVIVRASNRRMALATDDDKNLFQRMLWQVATRQGWRLLAWCVMGNHAHIALTTPKANLSRGMQILLSQYARAHNRLYDRTDHVFRSHFKSHVITTDAHLIATIAYIHRNPVAAGLAEHAADWPHSSYRQLMGSARPHPTLDATMSLGVLHPNPTYARPMLDHLIDTGQGNERPTPPTERPTPNQLVIALGFEQGVVEALRRGHTKSDVARAVGVTRSAISHRLRQRSLATRSREPAQQLTSDTIC